MMNKIKSTKGITLISLVITIIILLILAGVTIATLTGDNGLIKRAQDAKIATEIADIKEQIQTEILGKQAENQGDISDSNLETILLKYGTLSNEEKLIDKTLTTTKGNHEIKVSDIFNGTTIGNEPLKPYTLAETMGGANSPNISGFNVENTYYVTWGTTAPYQPNEESKINNAPPSGWSNYNGKEWANIKTTGGGNDCYWVWIPRYAYKVPTKPTTDKPTAETIEVKFLQGTSNKPIGETAEITNTTPTPGTWVVHPAFTNEGNGGLGNLTGIWVAKYEASSSSVSETTVNTDLNGTGGGQNTNLQVRVKPNVTSWRGINVNGMFDVCQNLTKTVTIDGEQIKNSLADTTNLDSHMMKNTEWGAVAYLSRSVYGMNDEVWNNPYYNDSTNYSPITGLCGNESNGKDNATTNMSNTVKYNEIGGGNASTTGNVYGVYDMAGGAWEYVAGIYKGTTSNNLGNNTNRSNLWDSSNSKYVDQYTETTGSQSTYYGNTNKYGDAVYETSSSGTSNTRSWDSSISHFPVSSNPVFVRGGHAVSGSIAGVFAFGNHTGGAYTYNSFRPVVLSSQP